MPLPPLLCLPDEARYKQHFIDNYVNGPRILTFDGIRVRFFQDNFAHAFYRDSNRWTKDKAIFDRARAERMDWIGAVLRDPTVELYRRVIGNKVRRIALDATENYVVIIQLSNSNATQARFITAYIVDSNSALRRMRSNPIWVVMEAGSN